MSCRQNLTSIGRHCCEHNQNIRVDSRTRVAIPARSRIAWDSRMGLFHCMAEDGIEDGKKRPVRQWAAGENSDDNDQ
jgi:hypothetical protein